MSERTITVKHIALYERLGYKCVGSLSHHTKVNGLYVASNITGGFFINYFSVSF